MNHLTICTWHRFKRCDKSQRYTWCRMPRWYCANTLHGW